MFDQLKLFRSAPPIQTGKPHHLQIGARIVSYTLRRAARRRLSMTIDERGLRIAAPIQIPLKDIEDFISSHGEWVLSKLDEYAASHPSRHVLVYDGARLPLLGGSAEIRTLPGINRIRWVGDTLVLEARTDANLQMLARRGLQRRALSLFRERVDFYAELMGHSPPVLALSSARTRWGSCSSVSGIRLNWRLIHLPIAVIDYVVVHELAHLVEMNHSSRFWAEVERYYPEWRAARDELKSRAATIPLL